MKKVLILLFFLTAPLAFGQDENLDDFEFAEETPFTTQELQEEKNEYFLLTGGYTGTLFFANFDDLNSHLSAKNFGFEDFESPLYLNGVQGITGIFYFVPNMRIGFVHMAGSKMQELDTQVDDMGTMIDVTRGIEYAVDYTGFSLDYAFVPFSSFSFTIGATVGWGDLNIDSWQTPSEMNFDEFDTEGNSLRYLDRLNQSYWFIQPNLNVEYALELIEGAKLVMFRVNIGYPYTFSMGSDSEKWKFNRGASVSDMPDGINANGLTVQFGIFVGLFNF